MNSQTAILVVDDNPPMVTTLEDILIAKGYAVHTAHSGIEALEILQHENVDIMLTDVVMPDMNGVELYRKTRNSYPHLITFLMTAYSADDIIQKGIAEGIKTVLTKPIDISLLLMLVTAVEQTYLHPQ
jgi:CheY-like chemotaxis protein